jgi:hypothetical protein
MKDEGERMKDEGERMKDNAGAVLGKVLIRLGLAGDAEGMKDGCGRMKLEYKDEAEG